MISQQFILQSIWSTIELHHFVLFCPKDAGWGKPIFLMHSTPKSIDIEFTHIFWCSHPRPWWDEYFQLLFVQHSIFWPSFYQTRFSKPGKGCPYQAPIHNHTVNDGTKCHSSFSFCFSSTPCYIACAHVHMWSTTYLCTWTTSTWSEMLVNFWYSQVKIILFLLKSTRCISRM